MPNDPRSWNDIAEENERLRETHENVIGAAMLVAAAFRLRDEEALLLMLRRLIKAADEYTAERKMEPS